MADLFQLPDGRRIRKGQAFELMESRDRVQAAVIVTDDAGNESIKTPAKIVAGEEGKYYPDNWLGLASPAMLKKLGIEPLEEEQPADGRFYFSSEGPVKKGVVTQIVSPREIEDVQRWLVQDVKDQARSQILALFPLEKQQTMSMRLAAIGRIEEPSEADVALQDQIIANQEWIEDVLAHSDALEDEIAKLKTAKAAEAWYAKPWEWPEFGA